MPISPNQINTTLRLGKISFIIFIYLFKEKYKNKPTKRAKVLLPPNSDIPGKHEFYRIPNKKIDFTCIKYEEMKEFSHMVLKEIKYKHKF